MILRLTKRESLKYYDKYILTIWAFAQQSKVEANYISRTITVNKKEMILINIMQNLLCACEPFYVGDMHDQYKRILHSESVLTHLLPSFAVSGISSSLSVFWLLLVSKYFFAVAFALVLCGYIFLCSIALKICQHKPSTEKWII